MQGWRIHVIEDQVVIDNKPQVDVARRQGDTMPEFQKIVVPGPVLHEAYQQYLDRQVVGSPD
jgi:hypothetical protein